MYDFWLKLGYLAIPLLLCSTVALAVILERSLFFIDLKKKRQSLDNKIDDILKNDEFSENKKEDKISLLLFEFNCLQTKSLHILQLVSAISPMLGLLGTVFGIMKTFQSISESTDPVSPALLAEGLWQAITTTAVGLSIAVLATLAYAVFKIIIKQNNDCYFLRVNYLIDSKRK